MEKKEIYLIDGSAYIHRAFHAVPHLSTSNGVPTNAAFGVTTMLLKLIKEREPQYCAVFFDVKGPTFRHKIYDQYKANRNSMPEELIEQIPFIKEIVKALNIPVFEKEGFEADDLIGTFARMADENGFNTVMVTGDKDFMQLVNDNCVIWDPMKDKIIDKDSIKNEFNIEPEQIIDMLGLTGDTSDNIPGVSGIGPKTAIKLLSEYGSIENIYKTIDKLISDKKADIDGKTVQSNILKKTLYKNLIQNREQAFLSRKLVIIDRFVDFEELKEKENSDIFLNLLKLKSYDNKKLAEIFKRLEFKKLYQELIKDNKITSLNTLTAKQELKSTNQELNNQELNNQEQEGDEELVRKKYNALTNIKDIENIVKNIANLAASDPCFCFSIDTETTSLSPMRAELVGISISFKPHEAFYIPVGHVVRRNCESELFCEEIREKEIQKKEAAAFNQPPKETVINILKPLLENPKIQKAGQNIKYDYIMFAKNGIFMQGISFDTMIASYLLNPSGRGHSLDQIALDLLNYKTISYKEVTSADYQLQNNTEDPENNIINLNTNSSSSNNKSSVKKSRKELLFSEVSIENAADYACEDADITLLAYQILRKNIKENNLNELMDTIEIPLIQVLANMEINGIKVDRKKLSLLSTEFEVELKSIEKEIFSIAGEPFNINSSQQLGNILFEKLKLPVQKKTKKKTGYSTDIAVLTELANHHTLPQTVLRYRSLSKLKSTYTDALQELINPDTGRIHTSFNQAVTATGRLSSSDPNLQNIPIRAEEGRRIREAFVPEKGFKFIAADYSQIELRILAHAADDKILIDAFLNDEDIHTRTAAEVFKAMPEFIDNELRRQAKAVNFGIVYGMGAFKLSNELSISRKMAQTYIDNYFARYSGVKQYIDNTIASAKESMEVATLFGRIRKLKDINSSNANVRGLAERMAINTPIQGSAADIIKLAMIKMDKALKDKDMDSKMILSVHDEILFEVPEKEVTALQTLAKDVMENVCRLKVPLKVNLGIGDNWAEAH